MKWTEFVKKTRDEHESKISYKEAMKIASPLWKKMKEAPEPTKTPKTRKRKKKKGEKPPEISEYPKPKTKSKVTRRKVARTEATPMTDLGGSLSAIIPATQQKLRGRRRIRKKHSVLLDSAHKFAARKSKVARV